MPDQPLWPLVAFALAVFVIVAAMMGLSTFFGERHASRVGTEPYESGFPVTGSARLRLNVQFYLVAILFVVFDLETMFIFAWAVAAEEAGWTGYIALVVFIGVLFVALLYEWRVGALDWATGGRPGSRSGRRPRAVGRGD